MDTDLLLRENRDDFIENNKSFIYKTTYRVCKRSLDWKNDDELSIALIAFNKACDTYANTKGNFFSYAAVLIKNSLIDFFRKSSKNAYLVFDNEDNDNNISDYIDYKYSMSQHEIECENKKRAEEILLFSTELKKYKLEFSSLLKSSPSHKDTRNELLNLALTCSKNEDILSYIKNKHLLPVTQITLLTNAKKKYIEKWRKYILTLILILSRDDYPYIKSYLNIKVGENLEQ